MIPYYEDVSLRLHHADCMDALAELPDCSVDSVVTDPPYGLAFMGKQWDALPPGVEWAAECRPRATCIAVEREAAYLPLILQRIARAQPPQDGLFEAAG